MEALSKSHELFVLEYLRDFNGTRAYQVAYPGVENSTARSNSSKLLANANISTAIQEKSREMLDNRQDEIKARLRNELEKNSFFNISDLFNDDGSLNMQKLQEHGSVVSSVDVESITVDGVTTSKYKVRLHNKPEAMKLLAKHLEFAVDKVDHKFEFDLSKHVNINIAFNE